MPPSDLGTCDCCNKDITPEDLHGDAWWHDSELHQLVHQRPKCKAGGRKPAGKGN